MIAKIKMKLMTIYDVSMNALKIGANVRLFVMWP